jgi:hypothetical protein
LVSKEYRLQHLVAEVIREMLGIQVVKVILAAQVIQEPTDLLDQEDPVVMLVQQEIQEMLEVQDQQPEVVQVDLVDLEAQL